MQVVAAVFKRADKVLVCRKKSGLSNAGLWEFPGGKRDPGESLEQALVREVAEELSVHIDVSQLQGSSLGHVSHRAGSRNIELHCFMVSNWQGEFVLTDHDKIKWCSMAELKCLELSGADVAFVERVDNYLRTA